MSRNRPAFLSFASGTSPGVSAASETGLVTGDSNSNKLPMLTRPVTMRNNVTAFLGEFVGTFLFLFFAFAGTQVANTPAPSGTLPDGAPAPPNLVAVIFISLAFGISLTANVWAFYRITGGLFNPCVCPPFPSHLDDTDPLPQVTLALALVGGLPAIRSAVVVVSQLLAGIAAAGIVSALFPGPLTVNTTLGGGASTAQGLFIEMFLTAELVFVIIMLAAEKHKGTYLAPVGIGTAFFLAELTGTSPPPLPSPSSMLTCCEKRRLLHRWLPQPRALPRPGRRHGQLPGVLLDLLPRPHPRRAAGVRVLRAAQVPAVEGVQSGAGLESGSSSCGR